MSSIVHIPFNFQPVITKIVSSTYTVPTGKYAKVDLSQLVKPVLNGDSLCVQVPITCTSTSFTTTVGGSPVAKHDFIHGFSCFSNSTNSTTTFYITGEDGSVGTTTNYFQTVNTTFSRVLRNASITSTQSTGTQSFINGYAYIFDGTEPIWLKSGDIISFTSGQLITTEYNNIS